MYIEALTLRVFMEILAPDSIAKLCVHGVDSLEFDQVRSRFLVGSLHQNRVQIDAEDVHFFRATRQQFVQCYAQFLTNKIMKYSYNQMTAMGENE